MYFLYVDGSGQTKIRRNSQDSGLYILSGVLVHERDKKSIVERIDSVKRELLPMFCPDEWELHARDIWNSKGFFGKEELELNLAKKKEIFSKIVDVACESQVTIINVIIFKNRLRRKNSSIVMKYSWSRLTDQFEYFLRQKQADTNNGLFIIDSSQKTPELEIKEAIRRRVRTGSSQGDIRYVIEDPIFVESHRHNLIQFADMIAYMAHKYYRADRGFENWFKSLKPKMYRHNGRLVGFGIVEFPDVD